MAGTRRRKGLPLKVRCRSALQGRFAVGPFCCAGVLLCGRFADVLAIKYYLGMMLSEIRAVCMPRMGTAIVLFAHSGYLPEAWATSVRRSR